MLLSLDCVMQMYDRVDAVFAWEATLARQRAAAAVPAVPLAVAVAAPPGAVVIDGVVVPEAAPPLPHAAPLPPPPPPRAPIGADLAGIITLLENLVQYLEDAINHPDWVSVVLLISLTWCLGEPGVVELNQSDVSTMHKMYSCLKCCMRFG